MPLRSLSHSCPRSLAAGRAFVSFPLPPPFLPRRSPSLFLSLSLSLSLALRRQPGRRCHFGLRATAVRPPSDWQRRRSPSLPTQAPAGCSSAGQPASSWPERDCKPDCERLARAAIPQASLSGRRPRKPELQLSLGLFFRFAPRTTEGARAARMGNKCFCAFQAGTLVPRRALDPRSRVRSKRAHAGGMTSRRLHCQPAEPNPLRPPPLGQRVSSAAGNQPSRHSQRRRPSTLAGAAHSEAASEPGSGPELPARQHDPASSSPARAHSAASRDAGQREGPIPVERREEVRLRADTFSKEPAELPV